MKTKISNLPSELLEEILARVPLESIRTVRLTCTKWNTSSKTAKPLTSTGESTMVAMMNHNLYLVRLVDDDVDHPSIEIKAKLTCLDEQVKISKVFHCEGLLLCILRDNTRLVVWNPYRMETRWIVPRYTPRFKEDRFRYALGYEDKKSRRTFKFLRFIQYFHHDPRFSWFEIYNFDSGLWRSLDVTPYWYIVFHHRGVSLKGNTYWCAAKMNPRQGLCNRIVCFDFARERFGPLLPFPFRVRNCEFVTLSSVREEKLSALSIAYNEYEEVPKTPLELQIWITTKIEDDKMSWSKLFKIEAKHRIPSIRTSYFIDEEKKVVMAYHYASKEFIIVGETGYRELNLAVPVCETQSCFCLPHVCSYVPSLVQVKEPARGKRINQNGLEKRRFAQNMLRLFEFENANPYAVNV